jgi:feruloyl esterase
MAAQRYPSDFDGIVAGAPVNHYQEHNATTVWMLQRVYAKDLAGNLAYDTDADGVPDSLRKLELLADAVFKQCDTVDGIRDGVIDNPLQCAFDPRSDLKAQMCANDVNGPSCFTSAQIDSIADVYAGPHDASERRIYKGKAFGSELEWDLYPYTGNDMQPTTVSIDHLNYLFYETDPGVMPADPYDLSTAPRKAGAAPEFAWWEFDIRDLTTGKADLMRSITDATDADLERFIIDNGGKLMLYHGWADGGPSAEVTVDYYTDVVQTTFAGNLEQAREHTRLFMIPGMYHCRRGPGPTEWDRLAPLVGWVEEGRAPDYLVGQHRTEGAVDNERRICAYPQQAVYTGPAGGQDDRANWVEGNFTCR